MHETVERIHSSNVMISNLSPQSDTAIELKDLDLQGQRFKSYGLKIQIFKRGKEEGTSMAIYATLRFLL